MNNESQNEKQITQLGRDVDYYKRCLDAHDPYNKDLNGHITTSYKKSLKLLETRQQLAILKERNIRS